MGCYEFYITPEEYQTAKDNGISKKTLEYRVRSSGWNKQRAITEKPRKRSSIKKYIEIANKNGICEGTFLNRIRKLKWSMEKASSKSVMSREDIILMLRRINDVN
jgi:hypothetical protein